MVPELDLTPPAATVPPFSPLHFPPANFNVPRAVVVLVVPPRVCESNLTQF
jgi:hypothetical protein